MIVLPTDNTSEVKVTNMDTSEALSTFNPTCKSDKKYGMCMDITTTYGESDIDNSSQPFILIGYENGMIVLWNFSLECEVHSIHTHEEAVMAIAFIKTTSLSIGFSGSVDHKLNHLESRR